VEEIIGQRCPRAVRIIGIADAIGSEGYNRELSPCGGRAASSGGRTRRAAPCHRL